MRHCYCFHGGNHDVGLAATVVTVYMYVPDTDIVPVCWVLLLKEIKWKLTLNTIAGTFVINNYSLINIICIYNNNKALTNEDFQ